MRFSKLFHLFFIPFAAVYVFVLAFKCDLGPKYDLDASWVQVLGWAFENGLTFGKDIVFTFGPFGYFLWQPYFVSESLYWTSYTFQFFAYALLVCWLILHLLRNNSWRCGVFTLLALVISFTNYFDIAFILPWLLFTISIGSKTEKTNLQRVEHTTLLLFFAIVSLAKFSFFVVSGAFWVGTSLLILTSFLSNRKPSFLDWAVAAAYPVGLLTAWLLSSHSLTDLFHFIFNSLEVSSSYSSSMALAGDKTVLLTGLVSLLLAVSEVILGTFEKSKILRSTFVALLLVFWTFFIWKISIVRQDGHVVNLFIGSIVLILISFAVTKFKEIRRSNTIPYFFISITCLALSTYGLFGLLKTSPKDFLGEQKFVSHFKSLISPHKTLQEHLSAQQQLQSPRQFHEERKSKTVDMFQPNQSLLLASGENYQPRPIFQGYNAWSPKLSQLNGLAYAQQKSPDYVFARLTPIDDRLPAMEDSLALLSLIQNYKPIGLTHWGFLYQKNTSTPRWVPPTALPKAKTQKVRFSEWIAIPRTTPEKQLILASVSVPDSIPRKIQSTLFREGIVFIEIRLEGGEVNKHRIITGQNGVPFILSPHIRNEYFLPGLYGNRRGKSIEAIRFTTEGFWSQPENIELCLETENWNNIHPPEQNYLQQFNLLPENINKANPFPAHGGVAFMYHAPSEIVFKPQKFGHFEIKAKVGLRAGSWTLPEEHRTDGAIFILQKASDRDVSELNRIFVDPANNPNHQKPQILAGETVLEENEEIRIKVLPGKTAGGDWTTIFGFELNKR